MTQELTVYQAESFDSMMRIGTLLAQSGFFQDSKGAAQAVTKMMAGAEIGFGPIASMTGINVIQGRVSISANLMAAAIKRSGRYDYRVKEMTPQRCEIEFRERNGDKWEVIGSSEFTAQDAKQAGTKNMDKFARNMLFARAMSNGARWYCPDIFGGPVYTPEEMGATVDGETGEVIEAPHIVVERQPEPPKQQPAQASAAVAVDLQALPFRPSVEGAIEWACATAPHVWPVDSKGIIVKDVVERSFRKLMADGLTGRPLMDAWIAKIDDKLATWQKAQAVHEAATNFDGIDTTAADPDGWGEIDAAGVTQDAKAPF